MAGVADFIALASSKLGVPAKAATAGTGGLLDMIRKQAGADVFGKLGAVLPDVGSIAAVPPAAAPIGMGGMLGGLAQKAGGMLGGGAGSALGVLGMLQGAGIGADKAAGFAGLFVTFLKGKLPADLLGTVLSKVGDLKQLAG